LITRQASKDEGAERREGLKLINDGGVVCLISSQLDLRGER
jgi:hypothetical protein